MSQSHALITSASNFEPNIYEKKNDGNYKRMEDKYQGTETNKDRLCYGFL